MLMHCGPLRRLLALMLVLCAAIGLSACTTTLTASKVGNFDKVIKGQVYYLPRSEYQVTVARELKACALVYKDDAQAALAWLDDQFNAVRAAATTDEALAIFDAIANDPVHMRGDIKPIVDVALESNWRTKAISTVSVAAQKGNDPKKGKPTVPKRKVIDNVVADFVKKIRELHLKPDLKFEVELTAQAAASFVPDVTHAYSLDYDLMSDGLKGTDYAVETYPNGTLKSVNVTIDDQTGSAILNVIGGVSKLAAAAGGFPFPAAVTAHAAKAKDFQSFAAWKTGQADRMPVCKPDTRWKLYQRAGLEAQSESNAESGLAQQKKIDKLNEAQVKAIAVRETAKSALKEIDANDPKRSDAEALVKKAESDVKLAAKAVLDAKAEQADMSEAAAKANARLAAVRKALTIVHSTTLRPSGSALKFALPGAQDVLQAWMIPQHLNPCNGAPDCVPANPSVLVEPMSAYAAIYAPSLPAEKAEAVDVSGIFYRQPLKSTLLVCKSRPCVEDNSIIAPPEFILLSTQVDVPQLGAFAVLPLKNGPFQNNTIAASFADSGTLTKVTYKSNAAAAKAAEVFESSADTLMKYREAKRHQETSKLETSTSELAAKKKLIDAQLALEKAQADLDKFRESKPTASPQ